MVPYPILRYNGKMFYEIQLKMISYANICNEIKAKWAESACASYFGNHMGIVPGVQSLKLT